MLKLRRHQLLENNRKSINDCFAKFSKSAFLCHFRIFDISGFETVKFDFKVFGLKVKCRTSPYIYKAFSIVRHFDFMICFELNNLVKNIFSFFVIKCNSCVKAMFFGSSDTFLLPQITKEYQNGQPQTISKLKYLLINCLNVKIAYFWYFATSEPRLFSSWKQHVNIFLKDSDIAHINFL